MSLAPPARVARTTSRHLAVITIEQLRAAGITDRMASEAVRLGGLRREHRGVFTVAAAPKTWEMRAFAAWATAGRDALVSHRSAAHIWGFEGFGPPGLIDVTVPRHLRPRKRLGVRYRESTVIDRAGATVRKGVPVTGVARLILDLSSLLTDPEALGVLDEAIRRRLTTLEELVDCLVRHAVRGRRGIRRFRRILLKRLGKSIPHGKFARRFERMMEAADLAAPDHEVEVTVDGHSYRIDIAYARLKIAIELDGREAHDNQAAYESDRIRQNRLEVAGWLVLRYTWDRFIREPEAIVREIREAIALRSCVR